MLCLCFLVFGELLVEMFLCDGKYYMVVYLFEGWNVY